MSKTKLIIITGPTATGKSDVAVEVAKEFDAEIISADSMQVYKYMDIGTAKPSTKLQEEVVHHLIDILNPDEDYNASLFERDALRAVEDITSRGRNIIVVGGTGLYIKALTEGLSQAPESDSRVREKLLSEAEEFGRKSLHDRLKKVDPVSAEVIHENNINRIVRALEVYLITGRPFSEFSKEHKAGEIKEKRFDTLKIASDIGLDGDIEGGGENIIRGRLYDRINDRVVKMIDSGLVSEVRSLLDKGYSKDLKSMKSLGYKEAVVHIEGKLTLDECRELIQKNTRHYGKRQMTWFVKDDEINWMDFSNVSDIREIKNKVESFLKQ